METRDDDLLRLASVLDDAGADQQVMICDRYIEYAFGTGCDPAIGRRVAT
jgi:hypothetical protein